jgi:hypothetical protein
MAPSYDKFIGGLDQQGVPRGGCWTHRSEQVSSLEGPEPLPPDYVQRIDALRNRLRLDATECSVPRFVRQFGLTREYCHRPSAPILLG